MLNVTPMDDALIGAVKAGHARGMTWGQIKALTGATVDQIKNILGIEYDSAVSTSVKKRTDVDALLFQMRTDPVKLSDELIAEAVVIADNLATDLDLESTRDLLQASKIRVEMRKFLAAKLNPDRYGQKPAESRDDTVRITDLTGERESAKT